MLPLVPLNQRQVINKYCTSCADASIEPAIDERIDARCLLVEHASVDNRAMHHLLGRQRPPRFIEDIHGQESVGWLHLLEDCPVAAIEPDQFPIPKAFGRAVHRARVSMFSNDVRKHLKTIW